MKQIIAIVSAIMLAGVMAQAVACDGTGACEKTQIWASDCGAQECTLDGSGNGECKRDGSGNGERKRDGSGNGDRKRDGSCLE